MHRKRLWKYLSSARSEAAHVPKRLSSSTNARVTKSPPTTESPLSAMLSSSEDDSSSDENETDEAATEKAAKSKTLELLRSGKGSVDHSGSDDMRKMVARVTRVVA